MIGRHGVRHAFDLIEWLSQQGLRLCGAELHSALIGWFKKDNRRILVSPTIFSERVMQTLIPPNREEFDAGMDKQVFAELWHSGHASTYFDILLRKFNGLVRSMPISERFQFVATIISCFDPPVLTLRKIELCGGNVSRHDIVLKQFYMLHGSEVLHHVAKALIYHETSAHLDLWTDIGVTAIQNGADPVTVVDRRTPLLRVLWTRPLRASIQWLSMGPISKRLQQWIHLLASANVDLSTYFSRESDAWKSVSVDVPCYMLALTGGTIRLWAVQYDAWSQRYSFRVRHETLVPHKLLHHLPCSFTDKSLVPNTICWDPSNEEAEEGHWIRASSGSFVLVGEMMDLHEVISLQDSAETRTVRHKRLIDSTQDDNAVLIRVLDKSYHSRGSRKSSSSQPISIAQRRHDFNIGHYYSDSHWWLPPVHYCIGSSAWVIGDHQGPRDCARHNVTQGYGHESKHRGFLAKVRACETGSLRGLGMEMRLHDLTKSCPVRCGKANFSALTIPQSLPHWHPGYCGPPE